MPSIVIAGAGWEPALPGRRAGAPEKTAESRLAALIGLRPAAGRTDRRQRPDLGPGAAPGGIAPGGHETGDRQAGAPSRSPGPVRHRRCADRPAAGHTRGLARAGGRLRVGPGRDVGHVADQMLHLAGRPPDVNPPFAPSWRRRCPSLAAADAALT